MNVRRKTLAFLLVVLVVGAVPIAVAQQGGSGTPDASSDDESDKEDYTNLVVQVDNGYPDLKPGESTTMAIQVRNLEDKAVTISPEVEHPVAGSELLPAEWLDFETDEITVDADDEVEFEVTVSVPEDADLHRYNAVIAVTDERIQYPGRPAQPLHSATLGVNVYKEPTVHVVSQTYLRGQIEAGDAATAEVTIENTGEEAVPLNPEIGTDRRAHSSGPSNGVLDPAWVTIDAPGEINPGERETVAITVSPPEDAELGNYRTDIHLGIRDPARPEHDDYWQRINLNVNVWSQPDEPYVRDFAVGGDVEDVTLTVSPRDAYGSTAFNHDPSPGSFEVTLINPNGERITPERTQVSDRGSVDMTEQHPRSELEDGYSDRSAVRDYVYKVDDPDAGTWAVEIQPINTLGFEYEINQNESAD